MIDPDLENFRMIPANEIEIVAVENVTKIEKENTFLRITIVIVVITLAVAIIKILEYKQKDHKTD